MRRTRVYTRHMTQQSLMTADELLRLKLPDKRAELIRGRLVTRPLRGMQSGVVVANICGAIGAHVNSKKIGSVVLATGFRIESNPDTVRSPAVAFVSEARLPKPTPSGYPAMAPDLAIEVLSPDDRPDEIREKVQQRIARGTLLVWVINPETRSAQAHRTNGEVGFIKPNECLDGETVLPGFRIELKDLFD